MGHFYWTKTAANSYVESYSDGTCTISDVPFFAKSAGGLTVDGQSGLYALSSAEWTYLLSTRGTGESKFKTGVTVNGAANCLVIAPDGYAVNITSSYDADAWSTAEASGLVCLLAAGSRNPSPIVNGGSTGYYWSATPYENKDNNAYKLVFNDSFVNPSTYDYRFDGFSVRLVCAAQ